MTENPESLRRAYNSEVIYSTGRCQLLVGKGDVSLAGFDAIALPCDRGGVPLVRNPLFLSLTPQQRKEVHLAAAHIIKPQEYELPYKMLKGKAEVLDGGIKDIAKKIILATPLTGSNPYVSNLEVVHSCTQEVISLAQRSGISHLGMSPLFPYTCSNDSLQNPSYEIMLGATKEAIGRLENSEPGLEFITVILGSNLKDEDILEAQDEQDRFILELKGSV